jgi:hypothetical protein
MVDRAARDEVADVVARFVNGGPRMGEVLAALKRHFDSGDPVFRAAHYELCHRDLPHGMALPTPGLVGRARVLEVGLGVRGRLERLWVFLRSDHELAWPRAAVQPPRSVVGVIGVLMLAVWAWLTTASHALLGDPVARLLVMLAVAYTGIIAIGVAWLAWRRGRSSLVPGGDIVAFPFTSDREYYEEYAGLRAADAGRRVTPGR